MQSGRAFSKLYWFELTGHRAAAGPGVRIKMDSALNLVYDEWPNFLGNRPMVEALLSRLRHYCHTVHIDGPSLRPPQS